MRSIVLRKGWTVAAVCVTVAVLVIAYHQFPRNDHGSLSVMMTGVLVMATAELTCFELTNRRFKFYTAAQVPFLLVLGPLPAILMWLGVYLCGQLVSFLVGRTHMFDPARVVAGSVIPLVTYICFNVWNTEFAGREPAPPFTGMMIAIAVSLLLHYIWEWFVPHRFAAPHPVTFASQWLFLLVPVDAMMAVLMTLPAEQPAILPQLLSGLRNIVLMTILYLLYTTYLQRTRLLKIPELLAFFAETSNDVEMAEALFAGVAALMPVDAVELWRRRDRARFHLAYRQDFALGSKVRAGSASDRLVRSGDGLVGFCASSREIVTVISNKQPLLFEWDENRDRYPSAMAAPILAGEDVEGVLAVYYRRLPFVYRRRDREVMRTLAVHIGQLYHSLLQLEETRAQMETDELTGLYNYRHFDAALHQCVRNSQERKRPVSLLILDIDHFKQINDTYGHLAGNDVLRQLASVFQEMLRDDDIIARYGGEEFTILLPDLDQDTAQAIAERLRKRIEEMHFTIESDLADEAVGQPASPVERTIRLTVSIGVSAYPTNADSALTLIRHADRAMYIGSKQSGRNRVTAYQPSK